MIDLRHFDFIAPNIKMLPTVVLDIIQSYVDSMIYFDELPRLRSVRRLMDRCDSFVLQQLGSVLGMPTSEVMRLRFRLEMRGEFIFYFHMDAAQRLHMLRMMEHYIEHNRHISCMTWIFLEKEPKLIRIPRYNRLFKDGLFCRLMEYLVTEPP